MQLLSTADSPERAQMIPKASVERIVTTHLRSKVAAGTADFLQTVTSNFLHYITMSALEKCQRERRKSINADDLLWAIQQSPDLRAWYIRTHLCFMSSAVEDTTATCMQTECTPTPTRIHTCKSSLGSWQCRAERGILITSHSSPCTLERTLRRMPRIRSLVQQYRANEAGLRLSKRKDNPLANSFAKFPGAVVPSCASVKRLKNEPPQPPEAPLKRDSGDAPLWVMEEASATCEEDNPLSTSTVTVSHPLSCLSAFCNAFKEVMLLASACAC